MRRRFAQAEQIYNPNLSDHENNIDRFIAYCETMNQAMLSQNFTQYGWGLTRAPTELVDYLKQNLHDGLDKAKEEVELDIISSGGSDDDSPYFQRPLFIHQDSLNQLVLEELQSMHEEWSGIPLIGQTAYGLRIYRNESVLHMHGECYIIIFICCLLRGVICVLIILLLLY